MKHLLYAMAGARSDRARGISSTSAWAMAGAGLPWWTFSSMSRLLPDGRLIEAGLKFHGSIDLRTFSRPASGRLHDFFRVLAGFRLLMHARSLQRALPGGSVALSILGLRRMCDSGSRERTVETIGGARRGRHAARPLVPGAFPRHHPWPSAEAAALRPGARRFRARAGQRARRAGPAGARAGGAAPAAEGEALAHAAARALQGRPRLHRGDDPVRGRAGAGAQQALSASPCRAAPAPRAISTGCWPA